MLAEYNWIGFGGYVFAFLLFFFGSLIILIIDIPKNIKLAKKYGLHFQFIGEKDFILKTPLRSILTYIILSGMGLFFSQKILFEMILPYWNHLLSCK